jgi:hypothetical protein
MVLGRIMAVKSPWAWHVVQDQVKRRSPFSVRVGVGAERIVVDWHEGQVGLLWMGVTGSLWGGRRSS